MDTHAFLDGVKVQRFYHTSKGEARIWYEPLRAIAVDWNGFLAQFRHQYSRLGHIREQLFRTQRKFHFEENSETIDSHVTCIRQDAALLGYGEAQAFEVLRNTLPSVIY